jgi:hypothetical protein
MRRAASRWIGKASIELSPIPRSPYLAIDAAEVQRQSLGDDSVHRPWTEERLIRLMQHVRSPLMRHLGLYFH